jgi:hypothetical protein
METFNEQFIDRCNAVQKTWAKFVNDLDYKLMKALRNSVKNSFLDLQKHIKTEGTDVVAIFKVSTKLDKTSGTTWDIVHEPSHPQIRAQVVQLMDKIRGFTIVLDRLEVMFRDARDVLVTKEIK